MYPLVRELATEGIPVTVILRVLKLSRAPYFRWLNQPATDSDWRQAHLANALYDAHGDDPEFGYRFLADEIRDLGHFACDRTIWALCSQEGLWSVFGKKRGPSGKRPGTPAHDDLVRRHFAAPVINTVWLTDITEHHTGAGKLYECAIKDVCSGRIVGYSIATRMTARLAVDALDSAVTRRHAAGYDVTGCGTHGSTSKTTAARRRPTRSGRC